MTALCLRCGEYWYAGDAMLCPDCAATDTYRSPVVVTVTHAVPPVAVVQGGGLQRLELP